MDPGKNFYSRRRAVLRVGKAGISRFRAERTGTGICAFLPAYTFAEGGSAVYTLRDICRREVVNLEKGVVIGTVDDIVFDEKDASVEALLIYGRPRLFGLLGRDGDVRIPWAEVISFGRDVILVSTPVGEDPPKISRLRFWEL